MSRFARDRMLLIAILTFALSLRAGVVLLQPDQLERDIDAYVAIARQIAAGNGYAGPDGEPTAFRPPLYPIMLAGVLLLGGGPVANGLLQAMLGTAAVWLTYEIGRRLELGRGALAAALLVAVDPLLVQYTAYVMTEIVSTFLIALLLWAGLAWRRPPADRDMPGAPNGAGAARIRHLKGLLLGAVFGLNALCRPTIWPFGALLAIWWVSRRYWRTWKPPRELLRQIPWAALAGVALTVLPWLVRNVAVFGEPIVTTTHGGYTLLLGNNPVFYREVVSEPWGTTWQSESLQAWQASLHEEMRRHDPPITSEPEQDEWMYDRAWNNIAAEPALFVRASWLRLRRFWNVAPLDAATEPVRALWLRLCGGAGMNCDRAADMAVTAIRWTVGAFYVALFAGMVAGLVRIPRAQWRRWIPLVLLILSFTAVHLFYWSNTRMRAPLMPAIALLAARGYWCRNSQSLD